MSIRLDFINDDVSILQRIMYWYCWWKRNKAIDWVFVGCGERFDLAFKINGVINEWFERGMRSLIWTDYHWSMWLTHHALVFTGIDSLHIDWGWSSRDCFKRKTCWSGSGYDWFYSVEVENCEQSVRVKYWSYNDSSIVDKIFSMVFSERIGKSVNIGLFPEIPSIFRFDRPNNYWQNVIVVINNEEFDHQTL